MTAYLPVLILYGLLQAASLILLPKWWKVAAIPALSVLLPVADFFRTGGGYMGDVLINIPMLWGCTFLVLVWILLGITKLIRMGRKPPEGQSS